MQLKFRAWNTAKKVMVSAIELSADQLTLDCNNKGFINVDSYSTENSEFYPHLTPLQFTNFYAGGMGTWDNEIYDGHIIDHVGNKGVVFYDEKDGGWYIRWINTSPSSGLIDYLSDFYERVKIIGSIQENPELMESKA